ncbi:MAG: electron transport complex subunit RsxC [Clostridia bacterium]|nr:electron transport complex subunit RsxC [Clostridia bacterium]
MAFSLHGVHLPHRKNTADMKPVVMTNVERVSIPMGMHIGAPALPVVKIGDHVDKGTLIGEQNGFISSPVYSSVSGTVKEISDKVGSDGKKIPVIVIESDGENTVDKGIAPPVINSRDDLIEAIKKSGIVGLGGAGFPTFVKLAAEPEKIEELIINGAECEPYITSDSYTMTDRADDMAFALEYLKKYLGIKKVIIGIENNKKSAIAEMKKMASANEGVSVKVLSSVYPQGGEKVLVYHLTGKVIPTGKLPLNVGSIVINCTTLAVIGEYLKTGMPLLEKCITVDGSAVAEPKNVIVPIGAMMADVFAFAGGFKSEPIKVLYGGPMMGVSVLDLDAPILKNTNAILAFNEKDGKMAKETSCIRCGSCYNICPFGISPVGIEKAYKTADAVGIKEAGALACMECGCCAYVCPAHRPLVQTNKLAKQFLKESRSEEKAKEDKK